MLPKVVHDGNQQQNLRPLQPFVEPCTHAPRAERRQTRRCEKPDYREVDRRPADARQPPVIDECRARPHADQQNQAQLTDVEGQLDSRFGGDQRAQGCEDQQEHQPRIGCDHDAGDQCCQRQPRAGNRGREQGTRHAEQQGEHSP
ncbi:MAG: hypothetical protein IPO91_24035 [Chloroflexi bacterium]|nr:hypothetical protein [Chloroflexota bacterium]